MATTNTNLGPDYSISYGGKCDKSLDIKDIAKLVRKDIKAAIKGGTLPTLKASVRISRYSGGQSLRVCIEEASIVVPSPDYDNSQWNSQFYTDEAVAALDAIKSIIAAYNYDGSDIQSDYFNVNFYTNVDYSFDLRHAKPEATEEDDTHSNFLAALGC